MSSFSYNDDDYNDDDNMMLTVTNNNDNNDSNDNDDTTTTSSYHYPLSEPAFNVTMSILEGRYLGSRDAIILSGNSPSATLQLYLTEDTTQSDLGLGETFKYRAYGKAFKLCKQLVLSNILTAMEICYQSNGGTGVNPYIAIATSDRRKRDYSSSSSSSSSSGRDKQDMATISLYKCDYQSIDSTVIDYTATCQASDGDNKSSSSSSFTSLAFNDDNNTSILAASNEAGEVIIWDLNTGKQRSRFTADACGVNKIKFVGGQLLTVGKSRNSQLRLWDLRQAPPIVHNHSYQPQLSLIHPCSNNSIQSTVVELDNQKALKKGTDTYTCISSDLYTQQKIICGTSSGSVAIWDVRKCRDNIAVVEEHRAHGDQVTSVVAIDDNIISSSTSGTVINTQINANRPIDPTDISNNYTNTNTTLLREAAPITCLDKIMDYRSGDVLMATSNIGGVFFKKS